MNLKETIYGSIAPPRGAKLDQEQEKGSHASDQRGSLWADVYSVVEKIAAVVEGSG